MIRRLFEQLLLNDLNDSGCIWSDLNIRIHLQRQKMLTHGNVVFDTPRDEEISNLPLRVDKLIEA